MPVGSTKSVGSVFSKSSRLSLSNSRSIVPTPIGVTKYVTPGQSSNDSSNEDSGSLSSPCNLAHDDEKDDAEKTSTTALGDIKQDTHPEQSLLSSAQADVDLPDRDTYSVGPGSYMVNDVVWCV